MSEDRHTPAAFARLLELPPEHPERIRAERDPRFQAWERMHRTFRTGSAGHVPEAERRDVDAELARRLAREIDETAGTEAGDPAPRPGRRVREPLRIGGRPRRSWVPALAAAAAIVVAGALWLQLAPEPGGRRVRGGPETTGISIAVRQQPVGPDLELRWDPAPGADHYVVAFLGADLQERARSGEVAEPVLRLRASDLPVGLASGEETAFEVIALHGTRVVGRSRTGTLRVP